MSMKRFLSHLFFCLSISGLVLAEEKPVPISIDLLVTTTLSANPELAFYEAEIAAAKAGHSVSGRLDNPELSLEVGRRRLSSSDAGTEGMSYSVSLAQPIEWPGRLALRKAIANRDIALAELGVERFRAHLAARIRVLGYALAAQQDIANAATEVADRYTALKDVMVQRDPAGIAPMLETKTIEAATVVAQAKAGQASIAVQKALLEINQLIGRRADTPLTVRRPSFTFKKPPTLAALLEQAAQNNYEMRIRRAELEQQGFKVELAKNERYPTFTVGPFVSHENGGEKETVAGIGLSLPLPLWKNGKANVNIAESRRIQAQAMLSAAQRELERQVTEASLLFTVQQARLATWKTDALTEFREAANLADRHYRLGAVPISTYVELQDKYLEAAEVIHATQSQVLESALTLEQLTGSINSLVKPETKK